MDLFEKATKEKVRFATKKGVLCVEDIWDLPLTSAKGVSLDNLARRFNKKLKEVKEESFVEKPIPDPEKTLVELKFELVKRVIEIKVAERDKRKKAAERKEKKEKILSIIADKQDESLKGTSLEDLQKMLAEVSD